jgi:hypothetical protein
MKCILDTYKRYAWKTWQILCIIPNNGVRKRTGQDRKLRTDRRKFLKAII